MDDNTFYLNIATALVNDLQNDEEKMVGNLWIEKFREIEDNDLRMKYTRIFIFSLQKKRLSSHFARPPPEDRGKVLEKLRKLKEGLDRKGRISSIVEDKSGKRYEVLSGNLREYFALQEIDNTFMHGYYVISADGPIFENTREYSETGSILSEDDRLKTDQIEECLTESRRPETGVNDPEPCKCSDNSKPCAPNKTRPCWGRNRYIERLIDQSPYSVGDLDVVGVNAMLENFQHIRRKHKHH